MTTQTAGAFGAAPSRADYARGHGRSGGWFAGLVDHVRARGEEHLRYLQTRNELAALTDRELADIGLVRGDIEGIARKSAVIGG